MNRITEDNFIQLAKLSKPYSHVEIGKANFELAKKYAGTDKELIVMGIDQVADIYKGLPDVWKWRKEGGGRDYQVMFYNKGSISPIASSMPVPLSPETTTITFRIDWKEYDPIWKPISHQIIIK